MKYRIPDGVVVSGGIEPPSEPRVGDYWLRYDGVLLQRDMEMRTVPVPTWKLVEGGLAAVFEVVNE